MDRLLEQFKKNKLTLIVSLPENSLELAKAAIAGGADALKVHCNVTHRASGTVFGPLEAEREKLAAILNEAKIPVGIVPGAEIKPMEIEMQEMIKMGFDYFDMYYHDMPEYIKNISGITKVVAIDNKDMLAKAVSMKKENYDALEAAIIPHLGYGQNLTIGDLQCYISIAISSEIPVIVPTQRAVTFDEVPIIADTGVKALMIGAIVTGKTSQSIEKAARGFRSVIDSL